MIFELPAPNRDGRLAIFRIHTTGKPLASDVNLDTLVEASEGMVGAEIEAVCRQAAMFAIREFIEQDPGADNLKHFQIAPRHFERALAEQGGRIR